MTNTKKNINEFNYGDVHVKYDMDALNKAIDGLKFDEDGECFASGLLLDDGETSECRICVHNTDDWEDWGDDVLHVSVSEITGHVIPDGDDEFIITSIGGYEAEIGDPKPTKKTFKTIPLWVRAGMTWNVTPKELKILLSDDYKAIGKMFAKAVKNGTAVLDGETYIPETIFDMLDDDEPLKVHLTDYERKELSEKSWDV
jgi:hypothetical protein